MAIDVEGFIEVTVGGRSRTVNLRYLRTFEPGARGARLLVDGERRTLEAEESYETVAERVREAMRERSEQAATAALK